MQDGRSSATAADVLIGVGGSLAVTGAVLLVLASVLDAPAPSKTKTALQRASDRRRVGPGSEHRGRTEAGGRMVRWTVGGRSGRRCSRSCWRRAARRSKGSTRTTAWAAAARAAPRERRRHRGAAAARPVRAEGAVCILATVPDPPEGVDDGGAIEVVAALRKIDLDEKKPDVTLGLDLDGTCTCFERTRPRRARPWRIWSATGLRRHRQRGRADLRGRVRSFRAGRSLPGQISSAASKGQWTILLRLRGYNGEKDDPEGAGDGLPPQGVNAGMPAPVWDGNDAWPVDDTSLKAPPDLDSAVVATEDAYVSGGVLVARFASSLLRIRGTLFSMDLDLIDVVVSAKLEPTASGQYNLTNGVVAGKWPLANAFTGLSSIRYVGGNKLCIGDDNYIAVKSTICGSADLLLAGGEGVCDALSFGVTFASEPAKLGDVVASEGPPSNPCNPDTDPANDVCD
ncbi:MAG: hypothetical protein R3B70_12440 [Polyangiaceae bacterium]